MVAWGFNQVIGKEGRVCLYIRNGVFINDDERRTGLFLRAKLHVAPTANGGIDVSIKPVSSDVTKIGNYLILCSLFAHSR